MLKRFKSGSFTGQIIDLVSGTALAQIILIGSAPILTRLFQPEAFGIVATYTSIVAILSIAACLRYELAIVIPESDIDAATLFVSCLLLSLLSGSLCLLLVAQAVIYGYTSKVLDPLGYFVWLIPIAVLVNGLHLALNYWNIRTSRFRTISKGRVLTQSANTGTAIGAGLIGIATGGALVVSNLLGHVINLVYIGKSLGKPDWKCFREAAVSGKIRQTLRQYKNFPIYSIPSGFFNTISTFLPILGLGFLFSPIVVGWYAFTMRILLAPISLVGGALSQPLSLRIARNERKADISEFVLKIYTGLLCISVFPTVFIMMMGEEVFVAVFGGKWETAGTFAQLVAPWTMIWFIVSPLSILFEVLERQKLGTLCHLGILLARILGLGLGAWTGSAEKTILLLSCLGLTALLIMLANIAHIAGINPSRIARSSLSWLGLAICLAGVIGLIELLNPGKWQTIILGLLVTCLFTTMGFLRCKPLREEFLKEFK